MHVIGDVQMPRRATKNSAGYDFYAPCDIMLHHGEWTEVGTGVYLDEDDEVSIPKAVTDARRDITGMYMSTANRWILMMAPKSGLGFKYGVRLANTVGIIDQDYPGEIKVKLTCDCDHVDIPKGKSFVQGIFIPFGVLEGEIKPTEIRTGGFGSTDKKV